MSDVHEKTIDEIDLLKVFKFLWNGKLIIITFSIISLIFVFAYQKINPNTNFTATTIIKPISFFEGEKYRLFNTNMREINNLHVKYSNIDKLIDEYAGIKNSLITPPYGPVLNNSNLFEITPTELLNLFLEKLDERSIFEKAIMKYKLVEKENYDNEKDFKEEITKFSFKLKIKSYQDKTFRFNDRNSQGYLLQIDFDNIQKWKNVLVFLNTEINNHVKETLKERLATTINVYEKFSNQKFLKINSAVKNELTYQKNLTKNKLSVLEENEAIARNLNIKRGNVAIRGFKESDKSLPIYLLGYEVLKEQRKLIKKRDLENIFLPNILNLQKLQRSLKDDVVIYNIKKSFENSPIFDGTFESISMKVATTKFESHSKETLYNFLAIFFGSFVGIFYLIIRQNILAEQKL